MNFSFTVEPDNETRLDKFISLKYPQFSRAFVQKLIDEGYVIVNGKIANKASLNLKTGYSVNITLPEKLSAQEKENLIKNSGIELLHEHEDFLIIYKPAGILTHPNPEKENILESNVISVVDWLTINYPEITLQLRYRSVLGEREEGKSYDQRNRPGIVHRLDFLTSGLMLIARNAESFETFTQMFKDRKVKKTYWAIVKGNPPQEGVIDLPIVLKPGTLKRMCVKKDQFIRDQKEALTKYKVIKQLPVHPERSVSEVEGYALVEVNLITGRTHQIRVHFAAIGHPVIGDELYGKKSELINRQALHAYSLDFEYNGQVFKFTREIPEEMQDLLKFPA